MTTFSDLFSETSSAAGILYNDLDDELAATRRTLERFPDGKGARRHPQDPRAISGW